MEGVPLVSSKGPFSSSAVILRSAHRLQLLTQYAALQTYTPGGRGAGDEAGGKRLSRVCRGLLIVAVGGERYQHWCRALM